MEFLHAYTIDSPSLTVHTSFLQVSSYVTGGYIHHHYHSHGKVCKSSHSCILLFFRNEVCNLSPSSVSVCFFLGLVVTAVGLYKMS